MNRFLIFCIACGFIVVFNRCNRLSGNSFVPAMNGYDGNESQSVLLKRPLREISGIDYINDNIIVAINDEVGKLFFVDPGTGKFESFEFGKKDDYEDVVIAGSSYFVMNSKGHLFEISISEKKLMASYINDFGKHTEFESLCYDRINNQLLLICKECGKNPNSINAYRFSLISKAFLSGTYFSIPWIDIRRMMKDNSIECKPSGASINPVNGKLYIIASLSKTLLQCSVTGQLEAAYGLNPDHFPQPEGICFSPRGDLYIANEGVQGKGTLLKFSFHPKDVSGNAKQ
jgi:hypothetical protein